MRDLLNDLDAQKYLSDPDPIRRAQSQMKTQLPKRFYKDVSVAPVEDGFAVHLDGKPVRTPGKERAGPAHRKGGRPGVGRVRCAGRKDRSVDHAGLPPRQYGDRRRRGRSGRGARRHRQIRIVRSPLLPRRCSRRPGRAAGRGMGPGARLGAPGARRASGAGAGRRPCRAAAQEPWTRSVRILRCARIRFGSPRCTL